MEIYVRRAHTYSLGVLQYSAVESVILFVNIAEVNRAHCTLLDMMELRDEAITVWTMAPTEAQVTACFKQCGIQIQLLGMGNHILLPTKHLPSEETPCTVSMLSLET